MFCPECKAEYRPGFDRCANCNVELVEDLAAVVEAPSAPRAPTGQLVDFCGFLSLDEAREARDRLRAAGIGSEIAIREAPDSDPDGPVTEEYWLRFPASNAREAARILEFDEHS